MALLPRSLGARLSWAILAPALLFFGALITLAWFAARDTLEEEVGARLADSAAVIAGVLPSGIVARYQPDKERTHANLLSRLRAAHTSMGARRVFLATLDGRSLVDTSPEAPRSGEPDRDLAQDRFELQRVARGETAHSVLYTGLDGVRYMRGFAPVAHEGAVVAVVGVEGSARSYAGLDALGAYMVGVGTVSLLALALLVFLSSRALTAPLARLAAAAERIGAGELDVPVKARGATELQVLGRTMDEMRAALLQRERELQMMLSGIAHEVRNPLGGMELFVGLLREDLADREEELHMLSRVERELGNLKRIVEEFLAFARRTPVEKSPVELAALVAETAPMVSIEVNGSLPAGLTVAADRQQLRRLLLNLLNNAAQAGAKHVSITAVGGRVEITDDGPGISREEAERIFDAFYTTREKGTGLGLALCRKIADAHGGRLDLVNPGEPGARFVLVLPADAS